MDSGYTFNKDTNRPVMRIEWKDYTGAVIDFSSGYTFELRICDASDTDTVLFTKSSGIAGAATSPNVNITFATSDWTDLPAAENGTRYIGHLYYEHGSGATDSKRVDWTLYPTPVEP